MQPALVNGAAGVVVVRRGQPFTIMAFTVRDTKIAEIYVLAAPRSQLHRLTKPALQLRKRSAP
jgi:hypothetical protein